MKITSFLSKLFVHVVTWAALLIAFDRHAVGIENLITFVVGFLSFSMLISTVTGGGLRSVEIPGRLIGRIAFHAFHWSRIALIVVFAVHGHFVAATLLALSAAVIYTAYREVRKIERSFKALLKAGAQAIKEYDDQVAEDLGYAVKKDANGYIAGFPAPAEQGVVNATTLEVKVNPNASRDPAFGYPFTNRDIAASAG